jgi:hypothetical protein
VVVVVFIEFLLAVRVVMAAAVMAQHLQVMTYRQVWKQALQIQVAVAVVSMMPMAQRL